MFSLNGIYEIHIKNRNKKYIVKNRITNSGISRLLMGDPGYENIFNWCTLTSEGSIGNIGDDEHFSSYYEQYYPIVHLQLVESTTFKEDLITCQRYGLPDTAIGTRFKYTGVFSGPDVSVMASIGIREETSWASTLFSRAYLTEIFDGFSTQVTLYDGDELEVYYTIYTGSIVPSTGSIVNYLDTDMITKEAIIKPAFFTNTSYWAVNKIQPNLSGCLGYSSGSLGDPDTNPNGVGIPATSIERTSINIGDYNSQITYRIGWDHTVSFPDGLTSILISNSNPNESMGAFQMLLHDTIFKEDDESIFINVLIVIRQNVWVYDNGQGG